MLLSPLTGEIAPDKMICGMTAIGISVIAISSVADNAEIARPRVTPANASARSTLNSLPKAPGSRHQAFTVANNTMV